MPLPSRTSNTFWRLFWDLTSDQRALARVAYREWLNDPRASGIRFKQLSGLPGVYSARITDDLRAIAVLRAGRFEWIWIGVHADYERVLSNM